MVNLKENDYLCFKLINIRFVEYINEFHKEWIERTRKSIEEWKKHPPTREEVLEQQKRLDHQRAIRESKQQNNKGQ